MAMPTSSRRSRRPFALPILAAAALFAVTACGSDESADEAFAGTVGSDELVDMQTVETEAVSTLAVTTGGGRDASR